MSNQIQRLMARYAAGLRQHLRKPGEAGLARAYELGRAANAQGVGVLELVRVHLDAMEELLRPVERAKRKAAWNTAKSFSLEALSPFEATHRGFLETNANLQQTVKTLETLSSKILCAQEEERRRISRDLHDVVGQSLTAISMSVAMLRVDGVAAPGAFSRAVAEIQGLLAQTMNDVHHFARELRPAMLDELGLLPALRSHVKSFALRSGLRARFFGDALAEQLGSEQKTALFRITQESLNNVAKHAQASRVNVSIRRNCAGICLRIADNGRSFRPEPKRAAEGQPRLGLLGMQERARLIHGQFAIQPAPGRGTTVRVTVPFPD